MEITQGAMTPLLQGQAAQAVRQDVPERELTRTDSATRIEITGAAAPEQVGYPDPYAARGGAGAPGETEGTTVWDKSEQADQARDPVAEIRRLALLATAHQGFSAATAAGMAPRQPMIDGSV